MTTPARKNWPGWILTGASALFLLTDGVMKLIQPAPVVDATLKLGYPQSVILPLGLVLTTSTLLYLWPATSYLGAILLTGYLGGAVATHVRIGDPLFNVIFPVIFGAMAWGGLWFRDARLRALIPFRS